jgi:hypothetical protein
VTPGEGRSRGVMTRSTFAEPTTTTFGASLMAVDLRFG